MTYQLYSLYAKIWHISTSAPLSLGLILLLLGPFFHPSINLDTTFSISASFFWRRSPTSLNKPLQIESKYLKTSLKNYLQINAFPDFVMVEWEE